MSKELLTIRKQIKKRKPTYKRVQANQFAKLRNDLKWRRPKGMGNKDRRNRKGHIGTLKVGYGSPKAVKSMNRAGLFEALVHNVEDLKALDNKTHIAVIGRSVGGRKRIEMLQHAKTQKIAVDNVKDIDKTIEELQAKGKSKKKSSSKNTKTKTSDSKESKVKTSEKEATESKESKSSESQTQTDSSKKKEVEK